MKGDKMKKNIKCLTVTPDDINKAIKNFCIATELPTDFVVALAQEVGKDPLMKEFARVMLGAGILLGSKQPECAVIKEEIIDVTKVNKKLPSIKIDDVKPSYIG